MAPTARRTPAGPTRPGRADAFASLCLVAAGLAAVLPLVIPWIPTDGSTWDGWSWLLQVRTPSDPSLTASIGGYGLLLVALAGGAMFLFGVCLLLSVNHRPFGAVTLALSLAVLAIVVWWVLRVEAMTGVGLGALTSAGAGFWLLPAAGVLGLFGSVKALASG